MPRIAVDAGEVQRSALRIELRDAVVLLNPVERRLVTGAKVQGEARADLDVVLHIKVVRRETQVA
jgi:hypothetical protein